MKKGIIFDMDGTLWDSSVNVCTSWDIAVRQCGYHRAPITQEEMQGVMGKTMDKIADILFPFVEGKEREILLETCCRQENDYLRAHGGILYPDIRSTMERLRELGYHLYIVSNCQSGYIEAFLDYYQLWDLIEDKQCYGDNGRQKAENIRIVMERNGLSGGSAVYVGDIQGDCDAAEQAGARFIHASYGFGLIDHEVPAVASFSELPQRVTEMFALR